MHSFIYNTPTKVVFGKGAISSLPLCLKELKVSRVLIHYGSASAERSGLIGRIRTMLDENGISHISLGGVVPNPRLSLVYQGIELVKREGVDLILAVGGGSVIDSSKAIAYGACFDGDVWQLFNREGVKASRMLPIGTVLTIAAAGSEMSDSCVITKDEGGIKRGYSSELSRPKFSLMDPELTCSLPKYQTACGCVDILMHTMERYFVSGEVMDLTDEIAEGLMRTVIRHAPILMQDPCNYNSRAEIMWAGSLSHNGLTGCGIKAADFVTHGLEHELSGMFDVAHGAGLAAIWAGWARYVASSIPERFAKYAVSVWGLEPGAEIMETALAGIERTERFFSSLGMPISLKELGIDADEAVIEALAEKAAVACGGRKGAARQLTKEDFAAIYRAARG